MNTKSNSKRKMPTNRSKRERSGCDEDATSSRRSFAKDNRSKGNSPRNAKNAGRNARADASGDVLAGINDLSWYTRYPSLSTTTANFPYPYRPGMDFNLGSADINVDGTVVSDINIQCKLPGVLRINWSPSVGYSKVATDPASNVGKEVYARVRAAFSGALDADAPDFVMYLMSLDSIFSYIAWLKRVYRTLSSWSPDNYTTPDWLMIAYGFQDTAISNLRRDKTLLLNRINELCLQTGKFKCPAVMDIFNRHYWMSDNVYLDSNSVASQMYVFNPTGFYTLNPNAKIPNDSTNTAAGLKFVSLPNFNTSTNSADPVSVLYNYGLAMITALDEWDDGYTISGYLKRAYDGVPSFSVSLLDGGELLSPMYVEEVLTQIENARSFINYQRMASTDALDVRNVYQNPLNNAVISQPLMFIPQGSIAGDRVFLPGVVSVRSEQPSVAENIIATRLQTLVTPQTDSHLVDSTIKGYVVSCGTELVESMSLIAPSILDNGQIQPLALQQFFHISETSATAVDDVSNVSYLARLQDLSQFDWHPFCYLVYKTYSRNTLDNNGFSLHIIGDTHNITSVQYQNMQLLHRVCLFSEFNAFSQA